MARLMGEYYDDYNIEHYGSLDFNKIGWYLFALHSRIYNIIYMCFFISSPKISPPPRPNKYYSNITCTPLPTDIVKYSQGTSMRG